MVGKLIMCGTHYFVEHGREVYQQCTEEAPQSKEVAEVPRSNEHVWRTLRTLLLVIRFATKSVSKTGGPFWRCGELCAAKDVPIVLTAVKQRYPARSGFAWTNSEHTSKHEHTRKFGSLL